MKKDEVEANTFLVMGAARSGIAAARLLNSHGARVIVADSKSREAAGALAGELSAEGIETAWGDEATRAAVAHATVMVKSPGIPQDNPLVEMARTAGLRIISEIELASAFVPSDAKIVAITGTNGKTTVTAWLTHVLNACGYHAVAVGNIGDAWSARLLKQNKAETSLVYVVETSSFQLENLEDFHPDVAILTNLSPDHMDRYADSMEQYVAAKANILRNLTPQDTFIYNDGDANSQGFARSSQSRILAFNAAADAGGSSSAAFIQNDQVLYRVGDADPAVLLRVDELPIPGHHNLENALAVALAALALGAAPVAIASGLQTFGGVEHRIELCGTRADGVMFYNDSKATNLDAMEKAVVAFDKPIVLIAGGRDAHSDYSSITHLIRDHVVQLVALGEAANLIRSAWETVVPTTLASSMADAVETANRLAQAGSVVVFSPACKSFDMYNNYEERGADFKNHVARVLENR